MIELFILGKLVSIDNEVSGPGPRGSWVDLVALAQVFIWPISVYVVLRRLLKVNFLISLIVAAGLAFLSTLGNPMNYLYYGVFAVIIHAIWLVLREAYVEGKQLEATRQKKDSKKKLTKTKS
jgi:uncharacterized membrane protein YvlD (DUF360 family)